MLAAPSRHSPSDSDSDYGSRSKKKKRSRLSGDEIRVSSRGVKVPNYVDDVADFEKFDSDEAGPNYYVDPNAQYKEEDEIEAVLTHQRDEERLEDPVNVWFDNIVR
jgi:chromodomain-helicase-DNA-binding protein 1